MDFLKFRCSRSMIRKLIAKTLLLEKLESALTVFSIRKQKLDAVMGLSSVNL